MEKLRLRKVNLPEAMLPVSSFSDSQLIVAHSVMPSFFPSSFRHALHQNCNPYFSLHVSSSFFRKAIIQTDVISSEDTNTLGASICRDGILVSQSMVNPTQLSGRVKKKIHIKMQMLLRKWNVDGYNPPKKNIHEIRAVDPQLAGWAVCSARPEC